MKILPRMAPSAPETKFYRRTGQINRVPGAVLYDESRTDHGYQQPNYSTRDEVRRIAAKLTKLPERLPPLVAWKPKVYQAL